MTSPGRTSRWVMPLSPPLPVSLAPRHLMTLCASPEVPSPICSPPHSPPSTSLLSSAGLFSAQPPPEHADRNGERFAAAGRTELQDSQARPPCLAGSSTQYQHASIPVHLERLRAGRAGKELHWEKGAAPAQSAPSSRHGPAALPAHPGTGRSVRPRTQLPTIFRPKRLSRKSTSPFPIADRPAAKSHVAVSAVP